MSETSWVDNEPRRHITYSQGLHPKLILVLWSTISLRVTLFFLAQIVVGGLGGRCRHGNVRCNWSGQFLRMSVTVCLSPEAHFGRAKVHIVERIMPGGQRACGVTALSLTGNFLADSEAQVPSALVTWAVSDTAH